MKAKEIVDYLLDNDLTKEELSQIANRLVEYASSDIMIAALRERNATVEVRL